MKTLTLQRQLWSVFVLALLMLSTTCNLPTRNLIQPADNAITQSIEPTQTPLHVLEVEPAPGTVMRWIDNSDFVYVPGGDFIMGRDRPERGDDTPIHSVSLSPYWIHQAEVTNLQYAECVQAGVCSPPMKELNLAYWYQDPSRLDDPVVGIDWFQAQAYCDWIEARLPTEAEWEKAARGIQGDPYPWGDADPTCNLLNFKDCLQPSEPAPVRSYPNGASIFNVLDMAGNVSEWVHDWYLADFYQQAPMKDPLGPADGEKRVVRGSSYQSPADALHLALRDSLKPELHRADLGFRCVLLGKPIPPACQAAAIVPGEGPPTFELGLPDLIGSGVGYCDGSSKDPHTGANVKVEWSEPVVDGLDYTADGGAKVACVPITGPGIRFNCSGPGVHQNETIDVTVCAERSIPIVLEEEPACDPGYWFNPDTELCEFNPYSTGTGGCVEGSSEVPGLGCLPLPVNQGCPPGYYFFSFSANIAPPPILEIRTGLTTPWKNGGAYCFPLDVACNYLVDDPELDPSCTQCPQGYTYLPDFQCCGQLPGHEPVCPLGFEPLNISEKPLICAKRVVDLPCVTIPVYVPLCPTPTPYSKDCTQFTSESACTDAGCIWHLPVTGAGGGYCSEK